MSEVLQANIFFFITGFAVIIGALLVFIVLLYAIGIIRNIKHITDRMRKGSDAFADDMRTIRHKVLADSNLIPTIISGIMGVAGSFMSRMADASKKRGSRRKKKEEE